MDEKQTNWLPTDYRFVAFIDILGFKDLIASSDHDEIYKKLLAISESKRFLQGASEAPDMQRRYQGADIYIASFSDSIVVFSKNDTPANFFFFLTAVRWLFSRTISDGIPIKGALAHGKVSVNKAQQIYFGKPIIDAYLMEEDINYMGASCHHSIDKYILTLNSTDNIDINDFLFEAQTPLKCGFLTHLNLNWFRQIPEASKNNNEKIHEIIDRFKFTSSGPSRKYVDNTNKFFKDNYPNNIRLKNDALKPSNAKS